MNLISNIDFAVPSITPIFAHNLQALWNRKSGGKFHVTSNGQLKTMGLWQRLKYTCSNQYRTQVQQAVKRSIKDITDNITKLNFKQDSILNKDQFITDMFFQKLAPLSTKVYTRDLKKSLITDLSSQIAAEAMEKSTTQDYKDNYAQAKLWAKLGNIESLGGASGSYCIIQGQILDPSGNPIEVKKSLGIFKPSDEEPLASSNTRICQKIKRWLLNVPVLSKPFRGSLLKTVAGQAYLAEAATKIVERFVVDAASEYVQVHPDDIDARLQGNQEWLKLVTDTQVANIDLRGKGARKGSFQLWVQETHSEASQFFGVNELYQKGNNSALKRLLGSFLPIKKKTQPSLLELRKKIPSELFDLLAIMDYATGNGDRHANNWFVMHSEDKNQDAKGVRLIDGGQSMAPEHPGMFTYQELHNRYLWRNLALSREHFTPLGAFIITKLNDPACQKQLLDEIQSLYTNHQPNEAVTTLKRLNRMKDRLAVMQYCSQKSKTKFELAHIRTHWDIKKVKVALRVSH